MKILSVRGKNLASLAGDWGIDFAAPPLARAGTFGIIGPTGAGKSTLLDAICLALFGQTPRYHAGGKHKVGQHEEAEEEHVSSGDARGILRRGCGEGHAEVEFEATDGRRYRARWTVQRAHKRAAGRFQNVVRSVVDVATGAVVEAGISNVDGWVTRNVGLTLEQFTRSVLLPQGEFAAFLRADTRDRAALLEKLTNTLPYGTVGRLAFERAREAKAAADEERRKLGEHRLLSTEELEALELDLHAAQADATAAQAQVVTQTAAVQWHQAHARLEAVLLEADELLDEARARGTAAEPRRQALAGVLEAEPLRSVVDRARQAVEAVANAKSRATESAHAAEEIERKLQALVARQALDAAALAEATTALETARPSLDEARRLDEVLKARGEAHALALQALGRSDEERRAAEQGVRSAEQKARENEARRARADGWIQAHPEAAPLAEAWSLARAHLDDFREREAARATCARRVPELNAALDQATTQQATRAAAALRAATGAEQAAKLARDAEAAEAEHPPGLAQAARAEIERQRLHLARARALLESAERATGSARDAATERDRLGNAAAEETEHAAEATRQGNTHAAALGELERVLALARATVDVSVHREALREGEACPLCGALDHPYAGQPPATSELLAELLRRERELRAAETAARADAASALARARSSEEAARAAARRAEKGLAELRQVEVEWAELGRGNALGGREAEARACLVAEETELQAATHRVEALEAATRMAAQAAATARATEKLAATEASKARQAADEAQASVAAAQVQVDDNARALREAEAAIAATLRALAGPLAGLPGWTASLQADAVGFSQACAELVQRHADAAAARVECERVAAAIGAEIEGAQAALALAVSRHVDATLARDSASAALEATRQERAAVLGGQPAGEVERALAGAASARQAAERASREAAAQATRAASAARATATALAEAHAARVAEAELVVAERDAALLALGLDLATAEQRLAMSPAWISTEKDAITALDRAIEAAATAREQRRADLAAHDATRHPGTAEAEAATALAEAQGALSAAQTRLGMLTEQRDQDKLRQGRVAEIKAQVAALDALHERRQQLNELLGCSTGNRFRAFVQSITLEVLVARANQQLARLAPRYRLARAPGDALALQVIDLDSAGAIRPVNSLSGGETFLASLALALALSSLAARDLRIGSLFIDEGFGTLDADTLDTVVTLLESLQSSGRQVGIITHVPGLADRLGAWVRVDKVSSTQSRISTGTGPVVP